MKNKRAIRSVFFVFVVLSLLFASCSGAQPPDENVTESKPAQRDVEDVDDQSDTDTAEQEGKQDESSVDLDSWKTLIGSSSLLYRACDEEYEGLLLTAEKLQADEIDGLEAFGEVLGNALVIGAVKTAITEWESPEDLAQYKDQILGNIDGLVTIIGQWIDGEITSDELSSSIPDKCDNIKDIEEEIVDAAKAQGITDADIEQMVSEMEITMGEIATEMLEESGLQEKGSSEQEETSGPAEIGFSRSNPFSNEGVVSAPNWNIEIVDVIRGQDAWTAIQSANQFNDPAPEGYEYLLVQIKAVCTYEDDETHWFGYTDFNVTGSYHTVYSSSYAVSPEPGFDGEVYSGGEILGWTSYLVREDETNLILILDELANWDDDRFRYIAIDAGASVTAPPDLKSIVPTETGTSRGNPAAFGEQVITNDWEIQLLDVVRGDEAWMMVQEANQFNDPPEDGMEYVAVQAHIRNIDSRDQSYMFDTYEFRSTGSASVLYDQPSVVAPSPILEGTLFPGGEYQGWVVVQAAVGEENLMVVYEPWADFTDENVRYLSLEK